MDPKYTLTMINGKPVSGREAGSAEMAGGLNIQTLPPLNMIERIEVIRGPMSSLYGSEAVGGMINIITKKVSNEWSAGISGQYNIFQDSHAGNHWNTGVYFSGPIIKDVLGIEVNGLLSKREKGKAKDDQDVSLIDDENRVNNAGGKLSLAVTDRDTVSFEYQRSSDNIYYNEDKSWYAREGKFVKDVFALDHEGKYDKLKLQSYLKYDKSDYKGNLLSNPSSIFGGEVKTLMFNTQGSYSFDKHVLTLGVNYIDEKFKSTSDQKNSRWNAAIFGEDDYFIMDNLILTLGARFNKNERFGTHFSPRAYGVYHINDFFTIKGGVSTGYMNPELEASEKGSLRRTGASGAGAIIGNSDLTPETSINYELGFAYNDEKINFSLMGFYSDFKDKIDMNVICQVGSFGTPSTWNCFANNINFWTVNQYFNLDDLYNAGAELSFDYKILSNLDIRTNYTYIKSKYKKGKNKGKITKQFPEHTFNLELNYSPINKFNLWTNINYKHKEKDTANAWVDLFGKPAYTIVDLGAKYKVNKNLNLNAGIYNALNASPTYFATNTDVVKKKFLDGRKFMIGFNANF